MASTDASVLLLGETGTGKELIARAIHTAGDRRGRALVTVNCATSPAGLLESEWFGHERGAFTGALAQKIGRFELAHQGTLFLDEIGDVPLELQSKLLRALQQREIERLGSTRTIRVDFRLIAATNRDLEEMVARREFRSDLYYRLNVFPIRIPPLRERREDIPLLVRYFAQRFAKELRRPIESVSRESMEMLCRWSWPGNIRELQNVIERAVILSQGTVLTVPRSEFESPSPLDVLARDAGGRRTRPHPARARADGLGDWRQPAVRPRDLVSSVRHSSRRCGGWASSGQSHTRAQVATFALADARRCPSLALLTHLANGGAHPRVPSTPSIQNDAEVLHSTVSVSTVAANAPASTIG